MNWSDFWTAVIDCCCWRPTMSALVKRVKGVSKSKGDILKPRKPSGGKAVSTGNLNFMTRCLFKLDCEGRHALTCCCCWPSHCTAWNEGEEGGDGYSVAHKVLNDLSSVSVWMLIFICTIGEQTAAQREEVDKRSIYVGNVRCFVLSLFRWISDQSYLQQVDYGATAEELQEHFKSCGTINRVKILCDKFTGHPKGYTFFITQHTILLILTFNAS